MKEENILKKLSSADSFTIMNGVCGLLSIFFILEGERHLSMLFILLAVLADGMDGVVARRYGGYLGRYMDEFSDIVSFLVAPIIFSWNVYELDAYPAILAASSFMLVTGMLHLIAYHVGRKDVFTGIPTPAVAIIIVSISYLSFPIIATLSAMVMLSVVMISPLLYPRIEKYLIPPAVVIILAGMSGDERAVILLLLSSLIYAAGGPLYVRMKGSNRNP